MISDGTVGIRAMEKGDLPLVQAWRNNSYFRQFFREYRELSLDHKIDWFDKMINDDKFCMFMIEDVSDPHLDPIGVAGLTYIDWVNRHADVHFYIGKDDGWIDKHYAPKAIKLILGYGFNTINMNKLWAEVYEIDLKKLRFYKKLGFNVDASLREHYFFEGKYITSHILSLLKREYLDEKDPSSCSPP
jgi:diamine N-acetyltransferase